MNSNEFGQTVALLEGSCRQHWPTSEVAVPRVTFSALLARFGGSDTLSEMSHEVSDFEVQVLERNKNYADGGAKAACKAIFQLLGARHPLVERYFRAFSSALHS
jgi:hypothetical protein